MRRAALVVVAACSGGQHPATPQPVSPAAAALESTIQARCADCHPGDSRPDLARAIGDPQLAWKAAEMVASETMPPNAELLDSDREAIVDAFCGVLGSGAEQCVRGTYVGPLPPLVRPPKVLSADIAATWQFAPDATAALKGLTSATIGWRTYDDPNFRIALSLAALRGCAKGSDGVTDRAPAEVDHCIRGIMARLFVEPVPLPGGAR